MTETVRWRSTEVLRDERLRSDPAFAEYWKRTALARAVALALIGYRVDHGLTQTQLAREIGLRQPQVARLERGEHSPSLEMLRRLSRTLGLRFIVEVFPVGADTPEGRVELPPGIKVVEDLTADGSRVLIAAG